MTGYKYRFAYARKIIKERFINALSLPLYSHRQSRLSFLDNQYTANIVKQL